MIVLAKRSQKWEIMTIVKKSGDNKLPSSHFLIIVGYLSLSCVHDRVMGPDTRHISHRWRHTQTTLLTRPCSVHSLVPLYLFNLSTKFPIKNCSYLFCPTHSLTHYRFVFLITHPLKHIHTQEHILRTTRIESSTPYLRHKTTKVRAQPKKWTERARISFVFWTCRHDDSSPRLRVVMTR